MQYMEKGKARKDKGRGKVNQGFSFQSSLLNFLFQSSFWNESE